MSRLDSIKTRLAEAPRSTTSPYNYLGYHPGWAGEDVAYLLDEVKRLTDKIAELEEDAIYANLGEDL